MNLSPRVSVCRSGTQHGGQGSCQHLARKDLWSQEVSRADKVPSPAGQSVRQPLPREIRVVWSSALVCGPRLCQQWSGACLSYTLTVVDFTLLYLFAQCLSTPDAKWRICPGAYGGYMTALLDTSDGKCGISPGAYLWVVPLCRRGYSDHMCRCLRQGGSPCQMYLFWLR